MPPLFHRLWSRVRATVAPVPDISATLWLQTLQRYPFLAALSLHDQSKLRALSALFLHHKEFHGAHGLVVTDAMAIDIAAQACLPLLHWGDPAKALDWYDDFVGIVLHPGEAVARRKTMDEAGVVHEHTQVLLGEAMERGPVMLSWHHVSHAGSSAQFGHNLVIHEFAHKFDMRGKAPGQGADGCPVLPPGFLGLRSAGEARRHWRTVLGHEYAAFKEKVVMAQRFGEALPWLDAYGAHSPAEFFAVACEAYWVSRERFGQAFPELLRLFDGFFMPSSPIKPS